MICFGLDTYEDIFVFFKLNRASFILGDVTSQLNLGMLIVLLCNESVHIKLKHELSLAFVMAPTEMF